MCLSRQVPRVLATSLLCLWVRSHKSYSVQTNLHPQRLYIASKCSLVGVKNLRWKYSSHAPELEPGSADRKPTGLITTNGKLKENEPLYYNFHIFPCQLIRVPEGPEAAQCRMSSDRK